MEPLTTIGVVAPAWLQESLDVLLQAAPGLRPLAYALTVEALFSSVVAEVPDLVLVCHVGDDGSVVADQIRQIKAAWPRTRCIALVEYSWQRTAAEQAGADLVLLQGLVPEKLLEALDRLIVQQSGRRRIESRESGGHT